MAEGRRSFPSGHTSTVFAGMVFLALFIAGLTSSWIFTQPLPSRRLPSSRLARLALTLSPLYYAMWVAVSRMEDYVRDKFFDFVYGELIAFSQRHHKEDVIMGMLVGTFTATTCYFVYWSNPFIRQVRTEVNGQETSARLVYAQERSPLVRHAAVNREDYEERGSFELSRVEPAGEMV